MLSKKEWKTHKLHGTLQLHLVAPAISKYTLTIGERSILHQQLSTIYVEYSEIDSLFVVHVAYYRCTLSIDWFDVIVTIIMHCSIIHRVSKRTWMLHIKLRRLHQPTLITYDPASLMYKSWESEETIMYNFLYGGAYVLDGLLSSSSSSA